MKPIELKTLLAELSPEEAKFIADGSAVFMAPVPDPADEERFLVDETASAANLER